MLAIQHKSWACSTSDHAASALPTVRLGISTVAMQPLHGALLALVTCCALHSSFNGPKI